MFCLEFVAPVGIIQVIHNYGKINLKFPKWGMLRHSLIAPNPSPIPQSCVMDRTICLQTWLFLRQGIHPAAAHFLTLVVMEVRE